MPTRFYNTLHHELPGIHPCPGADPDDPLKGAQITLYTCGPTVYDFAHIGNSPLCRHLATLSEFKGRAFIR